MESEVKRSRLEDPLQFQARHEVSRPEIGEAERTHLRRITSSTAERSPFPYQGKALTPGKVGKSSNIGQRGNASLAAIVEDSSQFCYLVSGLWSL